MPKGVFVLLKYWPLKNLKNIDSFPKKKLFIIHSSLEKLIYGICLFMLAKKPYVKINFHVFQCLVVSKKISNKKYIWSTEKIWLNLWKITLSYNKLN